MGQPKYFPSLPTAHCDSNDRHSSESSRLLNDGHANSEFENEHQGCVNVDDTNFVIKHQEFSLGIFLAGVAGNVMEWYDFAVFGAFSDIIGKMFFPFEKDGNGALVDSFATFGGAFAMRPVGGILLGYIGDVYGTKTALEISIFLMAFPTFAMGCLPTYESVGSIAIVLLIIVRLMQGLSVGGQLMSSLVCKWPDLY